jgi:hypothetical protein
LLHQVIKYDLRLSVKAEILNAFLFLVSFAEAKEACNSYRSSEFNNQPTPAITSAAKRLREFTKKTGNILLRLNLYHFLLEIYYLLGNSNEKDDTASPDLRRARTTDVNSTYSEFHLSPESIASKSIQNSVRIPEFSRTYFFSIFISGKVTGDFRLSPAFSDNSSIVIQF